MTTLIKEGD